MADESTRKKIREPLLRNSNSAPLADRHSRSSPFLARKKKHFYLLIQRYAHSVHIRDKKKSLFLARKLPYVEYAPKGVLPNSPTALCHDVSWMTPGRSNQLFDSQVGCSLGPKQHVDWLPRPVKLMLGNHVPWYVQPPGITSLFARFGTTNKP